MHNKEDIYGLDMCIEAMRRLLQKNLPVCFIFIVSSVENSAAYFDKNIRLIADLKLEDHFLLINERLSFVKLIERSDVVVRPTNTDGDALTVREALYLGKKTLASDVVERPSGTVLFKTRNINDFEFHLENIARQGKAILQMTPEKQGSRDENYKEFYLNLFNEVAIA